MIKYLIVVEETATGFSAYSPDLDGCVATGSSRADVEKNMREAIEFHLDGLRRDGYEVPKPHTYPAFFDLQS
jgi:predicted RNase H-like HicB family nuclease